MQQTVESTSSPNPNSFAGLLASLTAPKSTSAWDDENLADDVATLSYERALRTHARYRPLDPTDESLIQPFTAAPPRVETYELATVEETPDAQTASSFAASRSGEGSKHFSGAKVRTESEPLASQLKFRPGSEPGFQAAELRAGFGRACPSPTSTLFQRDLKSASITIRMSGEESALLHRRAAEAGLTVSAYLRSCTFEAESLRALVKETMAQLKAATSAQRQTAPTRQRRSFGAWLRRLLTPWRAQRSVARA